MSFDNSRYTFNPWNNYSGVVMQQGRVQTDSDWNEWLSELRRRMQAGMLDTVGRAVYPETTPSAFQIAAQTAGDGSNHVLIGPGRMYVDGLLAENHGDPTTAVWDPALAELSNAPQPPPATPPTPPVTGSIDYATQPYLPNAPAISGDGPFLAYLDVWDRPVTYIEDAELVDPAIGVDTTGRLQTIWQVKLMPSPGGSATCPSSNAWWPAPSAGLLTTGPVASTPSGPCCLSSSTGYTGQENQLYRVEIHQPGSPAPSPAPDPPPSGTATFKWSRDNGSVMTAVTTVGSGTNSAGNPASTLSLVSLGRDQVLGFAGGDWIELTDDSFQLNGASGYLCQIDTVDFAAKTITLVTTLPGSYTFNAKYNPRIVRWDQAGKIYLNDGTTLWWDLGAAGATGDIPVPPSGTVLILENGITVAFDLSSSSGEFLAGDFWAFTARTADGSIETLTKAPPLAPHHHYAALSVVTFSPDTNTDCRTPWNPPSGGGECGCCCTYTVGQGGQYSSINGAIQALPSSGGEVCILPGVYYENVFIEDRQDVVLRGCGWQTRIASASLNPNPPGAQTPTQSQAQAGPSAAGTFTAVITLSNCRHVKLESFCVDADVQDVGILLDGTGNLSVPPADGNQTKASDTFENAAGFSAAGVVDTTIETLVITASELPAILAQRVEGLEIEENRIAMRNVRNTWPAVQVSGADICIARNRVGVLNPNALEWIPANVNFEKTAAAPLSSSGIQIAGPSRNVLIVENRIEDCALNGITLGSYSIFDANGNDTGFVVGVLTVQVDECATTKTLQPGGVPNNAPTGSTLAAGGKLTNIQIDRNFIQNTGLCGIGPVGFFDLRQILEVINIEYLTIASNTIVSTVQGDLAAIGKEAQFLGYGAICLPDVQTLNIRDNLILNFGAKPGLKISGIFILMGEMVEISRNQILETRDWTSANEIVGAPILGRGGICVLATPPSFRETSKYFRETRPIYEPGLPALRVDNNVVRVPLCESIAAVGFGPFSVVNNHFACGGGVTDTGVPLAQTVLILNLGTAIETNTASGRFSEYYAPAGGAATLQTESQLSQTSGAVTFTNNVCQLEAQGMNQRAFSNVLIFTLDSLNFANNHLWLDGPALVDRSGNNNGKLTAVMDAMLLAGTLQVNNNRFQEAPLYPVFCSALTYGLMNITTENICTYCLFAEAAIPAWLRRANNLVVVIALCPDSLKG